MIIREKKIRKSARGELCHMRFPGICSGGGEDTIWAHSPYYEDGKGVAQKAHDVLGCYACYHCHAELDGRTHRTGLTRFEIKELFHMALKRSLVTAWLKGVIGPGGR